MKDFLSKYFKILLLSLLSLTPLVVITLVGFSMFSINIFLCIMLFLWPLSALIPVIVTIIMAHKLHGNKKKRVATILLMPTIYVLPFVIMFIYQFFFTKWEFRMPF